MAAQRFHHTPETVTAILEMLLDRKRANLHFLMASRDKKLQREPPSAASVDRAAQLFSPTEQIEMQRLKNEASRMRIEARQLGFDEDFAADNDFLFED